MIELSFSRGKISWKFTEKAFPVMEYIVCRGFIIRDAARELLEEWKKFFEKWLKKEKGGRYGEGNFSGRCDF